MRPGLNQSIRLGQELKINPRLYQAMDMLYMPLLDLQQHLKQELLVNPFLELSEDEEEELSESQDEEGDDHESDTESDADADSGDLDIDTLGEEPIAEDVVEKTPDDEVDWEEILLEGFDSPGGMREEHEQMKKLSKRALRPACLRMVHSTCSKDSGAQVRPMNSCRKLGMDSRAVGPRAASSTGGVRQPRQVWP